MDCNYRLKSNGGCPPIAGEGLSQLIQASGRRTDLAVHLEVEQFFVQRCMPETGSFGELREEHVALVPQGIDDQAGIGREVVFDERNAVLNRFLVCVGILPAHGLDEILGTSDEACPIKADNAVAAFTTRIAYTAGEGKDVAIVVEGD